jgi:hypothetical protein
MPQPETPTARATEESRSVTEPTDLTALRIAIFAALAKADGFEPEQLEPDDYETQIAAVVPLVLAGRAAAFREAAAVAGDIAKLPGDAAWQAGYLHAREEVARDLRRLAKHAAVSAPGGE